MWADGMALLTKHWWCLWDLRVSSHALIRIDLPSPDSLEDIIVHAIEALWQIMKR
jgi:hypothetical protein